MAWVLAPVAIVPFVAFCWGLGTVQSEGVLASASVSVLDVKGWPVEGVDVIARWSWGIVEHVAHVGTSRADGTVDLSELRRQAPRANFGRITVTAELVGGANVERVLGEGTVLPVAECGRLVVALQGPSGVPWQDPSTPHMVAQVDWQEHREDGTKTGLSGHRHKKFAPDGVIDFGPMEVGATVNLDVMLQGERIDEALAGPARPGETLRHIIQESAHWPCITGRLLATGGAPFTGDVALALSSGHSSMRFWTFATDGSGSFRFRIVQSIRDPWTLTLHPAGHVARTLELGPWGEGAEFDIGEVAFEKDEKTAGQRGR